MPNDKPTPPPFTDPHREGWEPKQPKTPPTGPPPDPTPIPPKQPPPQEIPKGSVVKER